MAMTKDGVSTTTTPGQFAYQHFYSAMLRRDMVQWDYRDRNCILHSGIARTLHRAKLAAQRASNEIID